MTALARLPESATLDQLAREWLAAKQAEDDAKVRRVEVESALLLHTMAKAEGADTVETAATKLTVTYGVSRAVDSDALQAAWAALPEDGQKCFRWSADVSVTQLRAIQSCMPNVYAQVAAFITAKPKKPAVKVQIKGAV